MRHASSIFIAMLAIGQASFWTSAASAQGAGQWKPEKPIEMVIMGGKGGGADKAGRALIEIIEKHKFAPVPVTAVNKPGESGGEGLRYLKKKAGDNHTLMFTLNSFYTTPLKQPDLGVNIEEMAPIARMAEDTFLLWVHADRKDINTLDDFINAANAGPWTMGGTGKDSEDSLLTDFLNARLQLKMGYKSHEGGGEVAEELIAKKVDSTVNNPSEIGNFFEDGKAKPIVAFTAQRLGAFPNTPTLAELGHNFEYLMQRSVAGAPHMSEAARAYYSDLFKKVYDSEEWQSYRQKNSLQGEFLSGKSLMSYWVKQRDTHQIMLKVMALLKG
jgi:tripartite-type tricarboxylate transporter receptor subunit TctC